MLVTLELIKRRQVRIAVGQVDDQAHNHLVIFQVIEERTTGVFGAQGIQRPASGVHYQALLVLGGVDFPQLFNTNAVMLGIGFAIQVVFGNQLFAQVAAAALGKQGVLAAQLHTRGVHAVFRVAFAVNAQVTGHDAAHDVVVVNQQLLRGETRVNFYA